jgi:hypothetical protein
MIPQSVLPLRGILGHQRKVGRHQRPFFISDIGGIGLAGCNHPIPLNLHSTKVHNTL